jgi:hypothetical protein
MHRVIVAAAFFALILLGPLAGSAMADEAPAARHGKKVRHVCSGPKCGPHTPCGWRCRIRCPDRYSCYSLYGIYGPYGGTPFWGAYTYTGWGYRY